MAEARAYSGKNRVYRGNSTVREKIEKEINRRERIKEKRRENPKSKGLILTLAALSALSSIGITGIVKDNIKLNNAEQQENITQPPKSLEIDENINDEPIGDTFLDNTTIETEIEEPKYIEPELVESNINEVLEIGDVVEFNQSDVGNYEQSTDLKGAWVVNNEQQGDNNWCRSFHRETGNYGYISPDSYEEFKPYKAMCDNIYYRSVLDEPCDGCIPCVAGDTVYVDASQIYTSKEGYQYYKYLVENEYEELGKIKYDYSVVYGSTAIVEESDKEYSRGLIMNKTAMRSTPELRDDNMYEFKNDATEKGVKYIVDISSYTPNTYQDYIDTLKTLQAKGLLGGVIMEIARSCEDGGFYIQSITGNNELDEKCNLIASSTNDTYKSSMGDYNQFKYFIEQTMEICPVGFYVFVDTIDLNHANQLAQIVYETEKSISNDIKGYNQATKFPLMVDVETGAFDYRQERTDAAIGFINRLSDLNVIKNQYMFYTSPTSVVAKKENINSGTQITCIEDVQEGTPDLTLINVGACYVNGMLNISSSKDEYKQNLEPENLLNSMYATIWYTDGRYMSPANIAQADIMQCMGNINNDNNSKLKLDSSHVIDISACTTDTYNAILNGTFKGHEGVYLANMQDSIQKYKSINGKEVETNSNAIEQENERE